MSLARTRLAPLAALWLAACRDPRAAAPPPARRAPAPAVDGGGSSIVSVARTPASGCPALRPTADLGEGTEHRDEVSGNETWTVEGSPHRLPYGLHVLAGASVTVAPCAVVLVGARRDVVVQDDAALLAVGEASRPIRFGALAREPQPGAWIGLEVRARARPSTRLAHAVIEHAGARPPEAGDPAAAIRSAMESGLDLAHVTVRDSAGCGVSLEGRGGFAPGATALVVTGARGPAAVRFDDADQVRTLPPGSYSGNAANEVLLAAHAREVATTGTWRHPGAGVRYHVARGAHVMVQGPTAPQLTVAPGVVVAFDDDAELDVGWDGPGALLAVGTEAERITFTAARQPVAPATWTGIFFGPHADAVRSRLERVRVEGAGAEAGFAFDLCQVPDPSATDDGMILLHRVAGPLRIAHAVFVAGPSHGYAIVRGGGGAVPLDYTDAALGNDFTGAGTLCRQSLARLRGACPTAPRCE